MKININNLCKVKFTKEALAHVRFYGEDAKRINWETGEYTDELWSLMNTFGEYFKAASDNQIFENNEIEIIEGT